MKVETEEYFVLEQDFGRHEKYNIFIDSNGNEVDVSTAGKIYDYLVEVVTKMARKRQGVSVENLVSVSKNGVKRFVRYDEGKMLYSMGRNRFQFYESA